MGPNFFIWIAMGIVVVSTIPVFYGYGWTMWIGCPLAVALAILNKVRAVRRRRAETSQHFD
jgi:membrane protein implicated in regulation of membrane protease activity